jgi:peptide/nickel transport system substrate-binding protein
MWPKSLNIKLLVGLVAGLALMGALACGEDEEEATAVPAAPTAAPAAVAPAPTAVPAAVAPAPTAVPAAPTAEVMEAMEDGPKFGGILREVGPADTGIGIPILNKSHRPFRYNIADPLVKFSEVGDIKPDLAESYDLSSDLTQITYHLRRDVKFHDGSPFTSADVIFTLDTIGNAETATTLAGGLKAGGEYISYSAPDDYTVVVTTAQTFAPILVGFNEALILSEKQLGGVADINTDRANLAPIGTGSFKMVEWKQNEFARLEGHEDYHQGKPYLDGKLTVFFPESEVANAAILAGTIDARDNVVGGDRGQFEQPGTGINTYDFAYWQAIGINFNLANPVVNDKAVREAISLAVENKDEFARIVMFGAGSRADRLWHPLTPVGKAYNPPLGEIPAHVFDLDKAKSVLDAAGWNVGSDGIREKTIGGDLERLEIPFTFAIDEHQFGGEILERYLQPLGINLELRRIDRALQTELRFNSPTRFRERVMMIYEWPHSMGGNYSGAFDPDLSAELHSSSIPPNGGNNVSYVNPAIDALVEEGASTFDVPRRKAIYGEIQKIILGDYALIPIYYAIDALAMHEDIKGITDETSFATYYYRRFAHKLWMER